MESQKNSISCSLKPLLIKEIKCNWFVASFMIYVGKTESSYCQKQDKCNCQACKVCITEQTFTEFQYDKEIIEKNAVPPKCNKIKEDFSPGTRPWVKIK